MTDPLRILIAGSLAVACSGDAIEMRPTRRCDSEARERILIACIESVRMEGQQGGDVHPQQVVGACGHQAERIACPEETRCALMEGQALGPAVRASHWFLCPEEATVNGRTAPEVSE